MWLVRDANVDRQECFFAWMERRRNAPVRVNNEGRKEVNSICCLLFKFSVIYKPEHMEVLLVNALAGWRTIIASFLRRLVWCLIWENLSLPPLMMPLLLLLWLFAQYPSSISFGQANPLRTHTVQCVLDLKDFFAKWKQNEWMNDLTDWCQYFFDTYKKSGQICKNGSHSSIPSFNGYAISATRLTRSARSFSRIKHCGAYLG